MKLGLIVKFDNSLYHTIPSGVTALCSLNFAIICDVESLTQVISNGTLRNLVTIQNDPYYLGACYCSVFIK